MYGCFRICLLGDRLLTPPDPHHDSHYNGSSSSAFWCTANTTGDLYHRYCQEENGTTVCDPYFLNNEVVYKPGIPGMFSGVIKGK